MRGECGGLICDSPVDFCGRSTRPLSSEAGVRPWLLVSRETDDALVMTPVLRRDYEVQKDLPNPAVASNSLHVVRTVWSQAPGVVSVWCG